MAGGGEQQILELAGDVRADRLAFERADEGCRGRIERRDGKVMLQNQTSRSANGFSVVKPGAKRAAISRV
jgi:hypothetical protein